MAEKIGIGAAFPTLALDTVDDGRLEIPAGLGSGYKVVLFYRGHW
jgi:hypothetical protein